MPTIHHHHALTPWRSYRTYYISMHYVGTHTPYVDRHRVATNVIEVPGRLHAGRIAIVGAWSHVRRNYYVTMYIVLRM